MATVFQRVKQARPNKPKQNSFPEVMRTEYTNQPVHIPDDFLAPLLNPESVKVEKIDFEKTKLKEYKDCYAVVLDGVLSQHECQELILMAEKSVGAHCVVGGDDVEGVAEGQGLGMVDNGWRPALVNAGRNYEIHAPEYRNSDRIIWDEKTIVSRIWQRVLQGKGMKEYLLRMEGKEYENVFLRSSESEIVWKATEQGLNERMRFLRYGKGQFFKEHCDGTYSTPDGKQRSFFTIHLYLNDSAQALGIPKSKSKSISSDPNSDLLRGGATTFHSRDMKHRLDVDPLAGRVLIFQHKKLLHSGDEVECGLKYTVRSDLMYEMEELAQETGNAIEGVEMSG